MEFLAEVGLQQLLPMLTFFDVLILWYGWQERQINSYKFQLRTKDFTGIVGVKRNERYS